jgi:glycine cleavage system aminomethyltransferase T
VIVSSAIWSDLLSEASKKTRYFLEDGILEKINYTANISFGPRVRKSPFFEATMRYGAKAFTIYNHVFMPTVYAGPTDEYWKLVNGVTLWDVTCQRQIEIAGPDALRFIKYITPRNLSSSEAGKCMYVLLTDEKGGIVNDAVMLHLNDEQFWLSPGDGDALLWVQGLAVNSGMDIRVFEPDVSTLQLQGPKSTQVIQALFGNWPLELGYYRMKETTLDGIPLVLSRTGWSGELGFELYLRDHRHGERLWDMIMKAGAPWDITPIAPSQIRSIEGGLLSYFSDISRDDSPYTLGMDRLVDLDQEHEFVGKEALKQIKEQGPSYRLVGIELPGEPMKGSNNEFWTVLNNGRKVGRVTRCIYSPRLEKNIGFVNIEAELAAIGTQLTIKMTDSERPAIVCEWPWIKAEKTIPAIS